MNRLSPREKVMLTAIAGLAFVLVNLVLLSTLWKKHVQVHSDISARQMELSSMEAIFSGKDLWDKRNDWLNQKQPKLQNRDQAPVELLKQVKQAAAANEVLLEQPNLGTVESLEDYQSVSISVETKSSWKDLVTFANTLLQPEEFIVFESCNLQIETSEPTKMRGKFRIAKWYAPE